MIYIGSHISSSKGYAAMGRQALKLGADTFAFLPAIREAEVRRKSDRKMWINF